MHCLHATLCDQQLLLLLVRRCSSTIRNNFFTLPLNTANTRAVHTVLRMVDLALERFPWLFGPGSRAFCFQLMQKLLGLLTLQPAIE